MVDARERGSSTLSMEEGADDALTFASGYTVSDFVGDGSSSESSASWSSPFLLALIERGFLG